MAAFIKIVPSRLVVRPVDSKTVNVVPRLVEHNAAPAAKACRGLAEHNSSNTKEVPIGRLIPVTATAIDRVAFSLKAAKELERPPSACQLADSGSSAEIS
jgi:hypothetical protein